MSQAPPDPSNATVFAKPAPELAPEPLWSAGTVLLSFEDPLPVEVPAVIIDREQQAFRLRHHCPTLHPGQIVSFEDLSTSGRAQVVSTERKDGYVETRFWIVADSD